MPDPWDILADYEDYEPKEEPVKLHDSDGEPINQTLNKRGEWVPSIPLPFIDRRRWAWGNSFVCWECPDKPMFKRMVDYRGHYALVHILGLD